MHLVQYCIMALFRIALGFILLLLSFAGEVCACPEFANGNEDCCLACGKSADLRKASEAKVTPRAVCIVAIATGTANETGDPAVEHPMPCPRNSARLPGTALQRSRDLMPSGVNENAKTDPS